MSLAQTIQTRHKCTAQIANQVLQTYIAHAGDRPPAPVNMVKPLAPVEPPKPKPLVYTFGESDASWEKRSDEYKTQYSLAATKALDDQSKYVEALRLYEADLAAEEKYKAWVTGLEAETPELVKAAKAAQAAKQRPKPVPLADKRKRQAVDDDDDDGGSVAVVGSGRASSRKKTKALSKHKQNEAVSPETLSSDEVWEPRVQRAIACRACVADNQVCLREAKESEASPCLTCQENNVKCERAPDGSWTSDEKLNTVLEAHRKDVGTFEATLKGCFKSLQDDLVLRISTPVQNDATLNAMLGRLESGVDILQSLLDAVTRLDANVSNVSQRLYQWSHHSRVYTDRGTSTDVQDESTTDVQDESTTNVPSAEGQVMEGVEDSHIDLSHS